MHGAVPVTKRKTRNRGCWAGVRGGNPIILAPPGVGKLGEMNSELVRRKMSVQGRWPKEFQTRAALRQPS